MKINLIKALFLFILTISLVACTKDVPPELLSNKPKTPEKQQMPDDSIHRNLAQKDQFHSKEDPSGSNSGEKGATDDKTTSKYTLDADAADAAYQKSKSETDKKVCIEKQMAAANFLMFEADLPPKDKYKPALIRYRRVLELDPKNEEASVNKKQIEDIYQSMGKPIPK